MPLTSGLRRKKTLYKVQKRGANAPLSLVTKELYSTDICSAILTIIDVIFVLSDISSVKVKTMVCSSIRTNEIAEQMSNRFRKSTFFNEITDSMSVTL